jgi:hypothetical protein
MARPCVVRHARAGASQVQGEGFQNLGSGSRRRRCPALGASADAPLLRLSRLLGCSSFAYREPAQRVRERRRVAGLAPSARRARPSSRAPVVTASGSCIPRRACSPAPAAAPPWPHRDAADSSALASRTRAAQVGAATTEARSAGDRSPVARPGPSARPREPALGLSAHRG